MSRTMDDIQKEYNETALRLGAGEYQEWSIREECERLTLNNSRLKGRMQALVKEAEKLKEKTEEVLKETASKLTVSEPEVVNE